MKISAYMKVGESVLAVGRAISGRLGVRASGIVNNLC